MRKLKMFFVFSIINLLPWKAICLPSFSEYQLLGAASLFETLMFSCGAQFPIYSKDEFALSLLTQLSTRFRAIYTFQAMTGLAYVRQIGLGRLVNVSALLNKSSSNLYSLTLGSSYNFSRTQVHAAIRGFLSKVFPESHVLSDYGLKLVYTFPSVLSLEALTQYRPGQVSKFQCELGAEYFISSKIRAKATYYYHIKNCDRPIIRVGVVYVLTRFFKEIREEAIPLLENMLTQSLVLESSDRWYTAYKKPNSVALHASFNQKIQQPGQQATTTSYTATIEEPLFENASSQSTKKKQTALPNPLVVHETTVPMEISIKTVKSIEFLLHENSEISDASKLSVSDQLNLPPQVNVTDFKPISHETWIGPTGSQPSGFETNSFAIQPIVAEDDFEQPSKGFESMNPSTEVSVFLKQHVQCFNAFMDQPSHPSLAAKLPLNFSMNRPTLIIPLSPTPLEHSPVDTFLSEGVQEAIHEIEELFNCTSPGVSLSDGLFKNLYGTSTESCLSDDELEKDYDSLSSNTLNEKLDPLNWLEEVDNLQPNQGFFPPFQLKAADSHITDAYRDPIMVYIINSPREEEEVFEEYGDSLTLRNANLIPVWY